MVFESFLALNEEKQKRIINAAMKEFIKGGYDKASINDLVSDAGISKGSIFYYFGNKKQMYLYLCEYAENLISEEMVYDEIFKTRDILIRLELAMKNSMKILENYPLVYEFVKCFKTERSKAVADELNVMISKNKSDTAKLILNGIDLSLFREDLDTQKVLFTIETTISELIKNSIEADCPNIENVYQEIIDFISFFRIAYYQNYYS